MTAPASQEPSQSRAQQRYWALFISSTLPPYWENVAALATARAAQGWATTTTNARHLGPLPATWAPCQPNDYYRKLPNDVRQIEKIARVNRLPIDNHASK